MLDGTLTTRPMLLSTFEYSTLAARESVLDIAAGVCRGSAGPGIEAFSNRSVEASGNRRASHPERTRRATAAIDREPDEVSGVVGNDELREIGRVTDQRGHVVRYPGGHLERAAPVRAGPAARMSQACSPWSRRRGYGDCA